MIVCDKCKYEFQDQDLVIYKGRIRTGNVVNATYQFFLCPKCKQPFLICIDDNNSRDLKEKISLQSYLLRNAITAKKSAKEVNRTLKQREDLKRELVEYRSRLKQVFGDEIIETLKDRVGTEP